MLDMINVIKVAKIVKNIKISKVEDDCMKLLMHNYSFSNSTFISICKKLFLNVCIKLLKRMRMNQLHMVS